MKSLVERRKYREAKAQEQRERATHASDTAQLLAAQRVKTLRTKEELGGGKTDDENDGGPADNFGDMTNAELENYIKERTGAEPKSRLKADLIAEAAKARDAEPAGGSGWGGTGGGGLTS